MDSSELVDTLKAAGLSPYQASAYVAVLELKAASATEIAEASDVPKPRIYDVLDELASRGYVETYEHDSLHARAHSPTQVLNDLRDRSDRFETAASEVEDRWEQPELEGSGPSIVSRFQSVIDRAEVFINEAEYQVQLSVTPEHFERLRPELAAAHERGVSTRISIHTEEDAELPSTDRFKGTCLEVRHRQLPAPFVALVDREKTCFAHHPDSYDQYGVLVNDRTYAFVFHWYFLTCLWEHWETIYSDYADSLPVGYVDIRQCVRDLKPLVDKGETPRVHIEGFEVDTGATAEIDGEVSEATLTSAPNSQDAVERLSGQVTLTVETDDGETLTIGGWGAMIEDIEATRITILDISDRDGLSNSALFRRP